MKPNEKKESTKDPKKEKKESGRLVIKSTKKYPHGFEAVPVSLNVNGNVQRLYSAQTSTNIVKSRIHVVTEELLGLHMSIRQVPVLAVSKVRNFDIQNVIESRYEGLPSAAVDTIVENFTKYRSMLSWDPEQVVEIVSRTLAEDEIFKKYATFIDSSEANLESFKEEELIETTAKKLTNEILSEIRTTVNRSYLSPALAKTVFDPNSDLRVELENVDFHSDMLNLLRISQDLMRELMRKDSLTSIQASFASRLNNNQSAMWLYNIYKSVTATTMIMTPIRTDFVIKDLEKVGVLQSPISIDFKPTIPGTAYDVNVTSRDIIDDVQLPDIYKSIIKAFAQISRTDNVQVEDYLNQSDAFDAIISSMVIKDSNLIVDLAKIKSRIIPDKRFMEERSKMEKEAVFYATLDTIIRFVNGATPGYIDRFRSSFQQSYSTVESMNQKSFIEKASLLCALSVEYWQTYLGEIMSQINPNVSFKLPNGAYLTPDGAKDFIKGADELVEKIFSQRTGSLDNGNELMLVSTFQPTPVIKYDFNYLTTIADTDLTNKSDIIIVDYASGEWYQQVIYQITENAQLSFFSSFTNDYSLKRAMCKKVQPIFYTEHNDLDLSMIGKFQPFVNSVIPITDLKLIPFFKSLSDFGEVAYFSNINDLIYHLDLLPSPDVIKLAEELMKGKKNQKNKMFEQALFIKKNPNSYVFRYSLPQRVASSSKEILVIQDSIVGQLNTGIGIDLDSFIEKKIAGGRFNTKETINAEDIIGDRTKAFNNVRFFKERDKPVEETPNDNPTS